MQGPKRGGFGIFIVGGLVAAAIITIVIFSGFSIGSITTTSSNPFGPGEGPPRITMVYQGEEYAGDLQGYVYDNMQTIAELPEVSHTHIAEVSTEIVNVTKGSEIQFVVRGNPASETQPNSLVVTAYTDDGRPVTVLDPLTPQNDTYTINKLDEGQEYVLSSVATWAPETPEEDEISGYVIYGHRISVVDSGQ